jgi:hypothetical protein
MVIDFGGATLPYGAPLPIGATNYSMAAAPTAQASTPALNQSGPPPSPNSGATPSDNSFGGLSGLLAGNNPTAPTTPPPYKPMPATLAEYQAQQQNSGLAMTDAVNPWAGTVDANGTWVRNPDQNAAYAAYAAQQNATQGGQIPVGGALPQTPTSAPQSNINFGSILSALSPGLNQPSVSSPGLNQPKTSSPGLNQPSMSSPGLNQPTAAPVNNVPRWWEPQYFQQQQRQMQQQPSPVQAATPSPVNVGQPKQVAQDLQRRGFGGLGSLNRQPRSLAVPFARPPFRR